MPLNESALPYLPVAVHVAFAIVPFRVLPDESAPIYMLHARDHDPGLRSLEDHLVPDLGWSRFGLEMTSIIMVGGTHSSMYAHPDMPGHIDTLFENGIMTTGGEKLRILSPPVTP